MRQSLVSPALIVVGALTSSVLEAGTADRLLRLVPPDSGITLAVEDLRDHAREIGESRLMKGLRDLPAVRGWSELEGVRTFRRTAKDVEAALGIPLGVIRDEIAGDAVVFSYRPGPDGRREEARGLLLALPRDPSRVGPMMKALDEAQIQAGELARVHDRSRGKVTYSVREFQAGDRPAEFYALMEGGVFAWSNSEEMVFGVIDREGTGGKGLGDEPGFQRVRRGLPERSVVSLFFDPRLLERAMTESPRATGEGEDRAASMLLRYVRAVDYAGASLQWRDGFLVHTHEAIDPEKLDPWLRRWLAGPTAPSPSASLVPASALAVVSVQVDYRAVFDGVAELLPAKDRPRLENLRLVLQGLFMGRDPVDEVLPRLGPETVVSLVPGSRLQLIAAIGWQAPPGAPDLVEPLDNALRTALAVVALGGRPGGGDSRVETKSFGEGRVTSLVDALGPRLSYRVDRGRVVFGNVPEEVARVGPGSAPKSLMELRETHAPGARTFAIADLGRLAEAVRAHRTSIVSHLAGRSKRPPDAVGDDLDQLLGVADLFRAAFLTSSAGPDATEIHRTLGLIGR